MLMMDLRLGACLDGVGLHIAAASIVIHSLTVLKGNVQVNGLASHGDTPAI
jgi:hypothetical protein